MEQTANAMTIGMPSNEGMWRQPPLGEVGEGGGDLQGHFHWNQLNWPGGGQIQSEGRDVSCHSPRTNLTWRNLKEFLISRVTG